MLSQQEGHRFNFSQIEDYVYMRLDCRRKPECPQKNPHRHGKNMQLDVKLVTFSCD